MSKPRFKIALMINVVAPSRIPVYTGLASAFDLLVLHGGIESNRDSWRNIEKALENAKVIQAWGWQIQTDKKENGKFFDPKYLHLTPGYIWHLLRFRPAGVISNEMGFRTLVALCYGTLFGRPIWVWWGGTLHTERQIGIIRGILRKIISRWARNWISYGQSSTEYLVKLGISSDRILQIQNAADDQCFAVEVQPEVKLYPRPVLLHVGQLIARKGIELLLRAASIIQAEGKEFSMLFVGSGRDKVRLEQLVRELKLKNIHFLSSRPPEQMPAVYRSGDVLIFPTLEDVWGLVANEAILARIPVLCSKYAGCAEELFQPENIFDPQNAHDFAVKLRQAVDGQLPLSDPSRLKSTEQIVADLVQTLEGSLIQGQKRRARLMIDPGQRRKST